MEIQYVMRTVDRGIRPTYLQNTIGHLHRQGIPRERIHVCPTMPDLGWIDPTTAGRCTLHEPDRRYSAPENMGITLLAAPRCDWVVQLEDDIKPCNDFAGSIDRWLTKYAGDYRLISFFVVTIRRDIVRAAAVGRGCVPFPLDQWASSCAIAMRWDDARACGAWIAEHASTWRTGNGFPVWANSRGADKMLAAWQAEAYPLTKYAAASAPCLVEHEGKISSLKGLGRFPYCRAALFTGQAWGK